MSRWPTSTSATRRSWAPRWSADEVAAGHRRAAAGRAARLLRRGRDRRTRRRRAAGQGVDRIATVVEGLRGLGADIEALPDGFVVRGTGGLRGGGLDAHGDHRLAMLGAVAGWPRRTGVEVVGMRGDGAVPLLVRFRIAHPDHLDALARGEAGDRTEHRQAVIAVRRRARRRAARRRRARRSRRRSPRYRRRARAAPRRRSRSGRSP